MSIIQLTQTVQILPPSPPKYEKQPIQPALPGMEVEEHESSIVTNRQIAEVLSSVANLIEAQNGNPYRVQAYRNAARGVLELQEPAAKFVERGDLLPVPGLGERLQHRIAELVITGSMTFYHDLCVETLPASARSLMTIEHVGPHTAVRLYEELGIDTPEKLWWAANQQRIRRLHRFGAKSEARLKVAAAQVLGKKEDAALSGVA